MKLNKLRFSISDNIVHNQLVIEEKRRKFLAQLSITRELSVQSYNSLLLLSENPLLNKNVLINDVPLNVAISFLEKTINELSKCLYEEMASVSSDVVWLDGITDYLLRRFNKIKSLDIKKSYYCNNV